MTCECSGCYHGTRCFRAPYPVAVPHVVDQIYGSGDTAIDTRRRAACAVATSLPTQWERERAISEAWETARKEARHG